MDKIIEALTAAGLAASIAAKKAAFVLPWAAASLPLSFVDLQTALGERGIAVLFACIANTIRWVKDKPSAGDVVTGYMIEKAIDAIPEPMARESARIAWEDSSRYDRDHPLISQIGAGFGMTPDKIDALWLQTQSQAGK